jgi:hypothetical protein
MESFIYKHLLITLLRLEFMVLVLFLIIYYYLCSFNYELYFLLLPQTSTLTNHQLVNHIQIFIPITTKYFRKVSTAH